MPAFHAHVEVTHLPGIADPAGATVERALPALGYTNVAQVHIGKTIRLVVEAAEDAGHDQEARDDRKFQRLGPAPATTAAGSSSRAHPPASSPPTPPPREYLAAYVGSRPEAVPAR